MNKKRLLFWIILVITVLFLSFQVIHFIEHTVQVTAWIFGSQEKPYMTPLGMLGMNELGILFYPNEEPVRQSKLGFELLHLFGNAIFLLGIFSLLYFIRNKKIIWALLIQAFHFYEHLSLTMSMLFVIKPIGFSTLFGMAMGQWASVAYRIWWHFFFNLIPSVLIALIIYEIYKNR